MRRFVAVLLGLVLGTTPFLMSAQGIPTDSAQDVPKVERVGNTDFRPTRRQLRKRARGRQASDSSTFLDYRMEHRAIQQQRTLENLSAEQRRARLMEQQNQDRFMERKGEEMMDTYERIAPVRKAPGTREEKNVEYLPSSKRSRPGEVRLEPERNPCLTTIGTRRARCYYRLQRMTVPGS